MTTSQESGGGITFHGPVATQVFRWHSVRAQLRLEKVGLRSSGGPIRPRISAELGLGARQPHDVFIAAIDAKIAELQSALKPGDVEQF